MLNLDAKNPNTFSKTLIAFKPRPILLAQRNSTTNMTISTSNHEKITPESKSTLHETILFYLHRNGFSKTLKKFQSEAQIQSDAWKASSVHLEDLFYKFNARNIESNKNSIKKPVLENDEAFKKNEVCITNEETSTKKKKKRGIVESNNEAIKDQSEVIDFKIVDEPETKPKKKKTKNDLDFSGQIEEAKSAVSNKDVDDTIDRLKLDNSIKKTKEKKKRSVDQEKLQASTTNENEVAKKERKKKRKKSSTNTNVEDEVNKGKTETENESISNKEKMSSKKRKRSMSDENENEHANVSTEMTSSDESKRQKTEISKEEKCIKDEIRSQETCNQQLDGQTNGKLEINGGEKSGGQKSSKKQRNATAEPKTVNAFQRVKIDQVEFAHEKLQDNSYWAKDGADMGYGAKAQEVLGQVRGRDFRHEKTKKKRGSYRGGLIDLQSHSIKFDYSDED